MKITIKTGGLLGKYLPDGSTGNTAQLEVPQGATAVAVMERLGMPDGTYLVIVNGENLPKAERAVRVLAAGDELAIMPPLKGG